MMSMNIDFTNFTLLIERSYVTAMMKHCKIFKHGFLPTGTSVPVGSEY